MCQDHAPELFQGIQLLWLRLDAPQGIAFARSLGGDAARGEALVTRRKQCGRGNMEPKDGGLEDDLPVQLCDF